jgi:hypothetical protein
MEKVVISIKSGQFSSQQIKSLEQVVIQNYKTFISKNNVLILWNIISETNGFSNFKPYIPSIINMGCPIGFSQEKRVQLFEQCTKDWTSITGQRSDELLISIIEQPIFNEFLGRNANQLTPYGKLRLRLHLLIELISSKISTGYYAFNSSINN